MTQAKKILFDGDWREAEETFAVHSPFSGEKLADVFSASANEMSIAAASAARAAREIRVMPRFEVAAGLRKMAAGIEKRKDQFTRVIAQESAKPMIYARGEVERAVATFSWAAGEAERFTGEVINVDAQANGRGKSGYTLRIPRGVIYGITPFNFPLNLVAHKVAPALASRNAIIIKPSPRTPLTALLLGEVFLESGLPKAAFQVVPMDVKYISAALESDDIAMISFTGSAPVGWDIKQRSNKKAVALELGGNAPVIVDSSADVDVSAAKCITGAFAYSGQVCISVQRVYVQEKLFDEWTSKFIDGAKSLRVGDPLEESTQISVMIDEPAAVRVADRTREAADNGAELLLDGKREGAMLFPSVLTNTDPEMRIVSEEAFGPVAVVEKFTELDEAIAMANHGKYGLQAGIFTRDLGRAQRAAEDLEYGGVIINDTPTFRVDHMPYGGSKESGFGREGVGYAMREMTEERIIIINS